MQIAAESQEPADDHSYLREKLRVTLDPVPGGNGLALVQAQVSSSRTAWLRFMKRMLTDRIDLFCQHHWRVLKLAGDGEWPLTDNPVLALNYMKPGEYDFGAAWGRHNSNFIMPISPRLAISRRWARRRPAHGMRRRNRRWSFKASSSSERCAGSSPASQTRESSRCDCAPLTRGPTRLKQEAWDSWNDMHLDSEADSTRRGQCRGAATTRSAEVHNAGNDAGNAGFQMVMMKRSL